MSDLNHRSHASTEEDAEATGPIDTQSAQSTGRGHRPYIPHTIRILAVPIILGWVVVTILVNVLVPRLEVVSEAHSAPMTPLDAPSMKAMMRLGHNFHEFDSNSTVMIVLEGQQPLGDGANDLGMIEHAGLGVAYHAKPAVAAAAAARIDFGYLTALLYAQGYKRDEFVGD